MYSGQYVVLDLSLTTKDGCLYCLCVSDTPVSLITYTHMFVCQIPTKQNEKICAYVYIHDNHVFTLESIHKYHRDCEIAVTKVDTDVYIMRASCSTFRKAKQILTAIELYYPGTEVITV